MEVSEEARLVISQEVNKVFLQRIASTALLLGFANVAAFFAFVHFVGGEAKEIASEIASRRAATAAEEAVQNQVDRLRDLANIGKQQIEGVLRFNEELLKNIGNSSGDLARFQGEAKRLEGELNALKGLVETIRQGSGDADKVAAAVNLFNSMGDKLKQDVNALSALNKKLDAMQSDVKKNEGSAISLEGRFEDLGKKYGNLAGDIQKVTNMINGTRPIDKLRFGTKTILVRNENGVVLSDDSAIKDPGNLGDHPDDKLTITMFDGEPSIVSKRVQIGINRFGEGFLTVIDKNGFVATLHPTGLKFGENSGAKNAKVIREFKNVGAK